MIPYLTTFTLFHHFIYSATSNRRELGLSHKRQLKNDYEFDLNNGVEGIQYMINQLDMRELYNSMRSHTQIDSINHFNPQV